MLTNQSFVQMLDNRRNKLSLAPSFLVESKQYMSKILTNQSLYLRELLRSFHKATWLWIHHKLVNAKKDVGLAYSRRLTCLNQDICALYSGQLIACNAFIFCWVDFLTKIWLLEGKESQNSSILNYLSQIGNIVDQSGLRKFISGKRRPLWGGASWGARVPRDSWSWRTGSNAGNCGSLGVWENNLPWRL